MLKKEIKAQIKSHAETPGKIPEDKPRVGIFTCKEAKMDRPASVREFYTSRNSKKIFEFADAYYGPTNWFMISDFHYGLITPDTILEPYNIWAGKNFRGKTKPLVGAEKSLRTHKPEAWSYTIHREINEIGPCDLHWPAFFYYAMNPILEHRHIKQPGYPGFVYNMYCWALADLKSGREVLFDVDRSEIFAQELHAKYEWYNRNKKIFFTGTKKELIKFDGLEEEANNGFDNVIRRHIGLPIKYKDGSERTSHKKLTCKGWEIIDGNQDLIAKFIKGGVPMPVTPNKYQGK